MMLKTDIANMALGYLGTSLTISDLDTDSSQQAKIIRRNFSDSLIEFLELHAWGFAGNVAPLALLDTNPPTGYKYVYQYPSDAQILRQIACEGIFTHLEQHDENRVQWQEFYSSSGPAIHTNVPDAWAMYTTKIDEDYGFPNHFGRGLAAQLAKNIAPSLITQNFAKIKQALADDLDNRMSKAIALDLNRSPRPREQINPFIAARNSC